MYCIQSLEGESETSPRDDDPVVSCVPHCYTQDVTLACCLPPGAYTIVPSTYQPDCSASFTLSLARRIHRLALFRSECDCAANGSGFRCQCYILSLS